MQALMSPYVGMTASIKSLHTLQELLYVPYKIHMKIVIVHATDLWLSSSGHQWILRGHMPCKPGYAHAGILLLCWTHAIIQWIIVCLLTAIVVLRYLKTWPLVLRFHVEYIVLEHKQYYNASVYKAHIGVAHIVASVCSEDTCKTQRMVLVAENGLRGNLRVSNFKYYMAGAFL